MEKLTDEDRMAIIEKQHLVILKQSEINTKAIASFKRETSERFDEVLEDTKTILSLFDALQGGFAFLGYLGKAAKWFTAVVLAVGAAIGLYHGGKLPLPPP